MRICQIYFKTVLCLSMAEKTETAERCEKMTNTGEAEEEGGNTAGSSNSDNTADTIVTSDTGMAPPTSLAEQLRLAERGVAIHNISGEESEDETLLNKENEEVEEGRGDTGASSDDASAALLATITDQEGLVLTGGDWFKTIKNAAANNDETERELAERMKKAKISKMSQATLENEVFEGNPPTPALPMRAPVCCKKIAKKTSAAAGKSWFLGPVP